MEENKSIESEPMIEPTETPVEPAVSDKCVICDGKGRVSDTESCGACEGTGVGK